MKANAATAPCDLGGGAHGHLEIMLTVPEYANISVTNYVCPLHPGLLNITEGTTNYELTRLLNEHKKFSD